MRVFVVVHIWKDAEDHCDFIDVSLKELEAYKLCNSLNQRNEIGYYDVVVKDCEFK